MKRFRTQRLLRCFSGAAILFGTFEACSSNDTSAPLPPAGEVSVDISSISFGCDQRIGVVLSFGPGWTLRPTGLCATSQCGPVRVTLSETSGGEPLIKQDAASSAVDLHGRDLRAGDYVVTAQLLDNAGKPVVLNDGGNSTVERSVHIELPTNCNSSAAGAGGADTMSGAGAGGSAGSAEGGGPSEAGAAGSAGASSAGAAGVAGDPSSAGSAGSAGA